MELNLVKVQTFYTSKINEGAKESGVNMTQYAMQCVKTAAQHIYMLAKSQGVNLQSVSVQNDITNILLRIASLEINLNSDPAEGYLITRNVKNPDNSKYKTIEFGIQGDGNDTILSKFGRNVAHVYPYWLVRDGDKFSYPSYNGIEQVPPQWQPEGTDNKVVKVVLPVAFETIDDSQDVRYFITTREQVKRNLFAHISQNLMFDNNKTTLLNELEDYFNEHSLDEFLNDKKLVTKYKVSPAWKSYQSRESMIVRKMKNNIVKKIPKDFSNAVQQLTYQQNSDNEDRKVINADEGNATIDFDTAVHDSADKIKQEKTAKIEENTKPVDQVDDYLNRKTAEKVPVEEQKTDNKDFDFKEL